MDGDCAAELAFLQKPDAAVDTKNIDPNEIFTPDDIQEFTEIFNLFDEDGSGEITVEVSGLHGVEAPIFMLWWKCDEAGDVCHRNWRR